MQLFIALSFLVASLLSSAFAGTSIKVQNDSLDDE